MESNGTSVMISSWSDEGSVIGNSVGNHPIEPNRPPRLDAIIDFLVPIGWDYQDYNRDYNP